MTPILLLLICLHGECHQVKVDPPSAITRAMCEEKANSEFAKGRDTIAAADPEMGKALELNDFICGYTRGHGA